MRWSHPHPRLVVGDVVMAYIRTSESVPQIRSVKVRTIGLTGCVYTYNYDTKDSFTYDNVQYVRRNGKWKNA